MAIEDYAVITVVLLFAVCAAVLSAQQPKGHWTSTQCFTNTCIADTLNRLDSERASEAKLTTWGNATYVWYRE